MSTRNKTLCALGAAALLATIVGVSAFSREPVTTAAPATRVELAPPMTALLHVNPGEKAPDEINMIVEIPRGSQNKYEFDARERVMKLDRVLASPFHYPGEYGFVPRTVNDDGDPLDVLVVSTAPTYPGTMIAARPIGVLCKVDNGDQDDLILAVPVKDPRFAKVRELSDVPEAVRDEIAHFFSVYKTLEKKTVTVSGWEGSTEAKAKINKALAAFSSAAPVAGALKLAAAVAASATLPAR